MREAKGAHPFHQPALNMFCKKKSCVCLQLFSLMEIRRRRL
jgi:hypothetical protein